MLHKKLNDKIAKISNTKNILKKYNFSFQKRFGQNFLIDLHVLEKIIDGAEVTKDDLVIEIGPGIGSLTQYLAENSKKVIAIEIDKKLIPILKDTLGGYKNIKIINEDILKINLNDLINLEEDIKDVKVIANLPYYITTPIIMGILEENIPVSSITVMIQKEVADRIQAKPGSKQYGALSLAVNYYANPKIIANVPPNCFIPRPNVGSTVITMNIRKDKPKVKDEKLLFKLIKIAFNQRRKTLTNSLYNIGDFNLSKEEINQILIKSGFDSKIRGETFSLEDFIILADNLYDYTNGNTKIE